MAPVVLLAAIALGSALLLVSTPHGQAAVIEIADAEAVESPNAAICIDPNDSDPFLEAELVDDCDDARVTDAMVLPTTGNPWIELDFSGQRIRSEFAPGGGELDGLVRGARIDLRGTGVNQNEIDLSAAISNGGLLCHAIYGDAESPNPPCLAATDPGDSDGPYSLTFLLDGGDDETGLGNLPTSVDEGGILYVPFHFGQRPRGLNFPVINGVACTGTPPNVGCTGSSLDGERGSGNTVERFVAFELTIEHKGLDFERTAYVMTSSRDPDDTLYVVPILIGDDSVIDEGDNAEIEVTGVQIGRNQSGDLSTPNSERTSGFDLGYLYARGAILDGYDDDFEDDLGTATDSVLVNDDDSPQYPVCERHPQVVAAIENDSAVSEKCRRISLDSLGMIESLAIYPGATDIDDPLEEIYYSDLEGLTGVTFLDLAGNELRDLPANAFRDVGVGTVRDVEVGDENLVALIDMRFNPGRRSANDGFLPTDVSSSIRSNLLNRQVLRVDTPARGFAALPDRFPRIYESDVLVFDAHVESGSPVITFSGTGSCNLHLGADASETAACTAEADDLPVEISLVDNSNAGSGTYVIAVKFPFESTDDGVAETFELVLGNGSGEVARKRLTITDVSRERTRTVSTSSRVYQPPSRPTSRPAPADRPSFDYPVFVVDNLYVVESDNPNLRHNIPDLSATISGRSVSAGFLSHYRNTGGLERWGYPTSEVLVLEDGTLTQFYQRGVVDFHDVGLGWVVERRLAWDYVGGGAGGSIDQGFESGPFNTNPGTLHGPWGNRVSNVSVEGTNVGFADFFDRLGGVLAFGVPKTEARTDIVSGNRLLGPNLTPGFIRQYFQAAVLEFHPNDPADPVKLSLLGDTLRDRLVPDHSRQRAFAATGRLTLDTEYIPPIVD